MGMYILSLFITLQHYFEPYMKSLLTERNFAVLLFVAVLISFVMAYEDSRKMQVVEITAVPTLPVKQKQVFANKESKQTSVTTKFEIKARP
jgi:hypothetical protein